MNSVPEQLFDSAGANIDLAIDASTLVADPTVREWQFTNLQAVKRFPKPFYNPGTHTARIYATGLNCLGLMREVRDPLLSYWVHIDMKQAHLRIASGLWDCPEIRDYISQHPELWLDFADFAGVPLTDTTTQAIKDFLYSVEFGMERDNVVYHLGLIIGSERASGLMSHPVYELLFAARDKRIQRFYENPVLIDACGQEFRLTGKTKYQRADSARSLLANEAQGMEQAIMHSAVQYAESTQGSDKECWITVWLHDGIWIHCDPQFQELHIQGIEAAIRARSRGLLGFEMEVEVKRPSN